MTSAYRYDAADIATQSLKAHYSPDDEHGLYQLRKLYTAAFQSCPSIVGY